MALEPLKALEIQSVKLKEAFSELKGLVFHSLFGFYSSDVQLKLFASKWKQLIVHAV